MIVGLNVGGVSILVEIVEPVMYVDGGFTSYATILSPVILLDAVTVFSRI